MNGKLATLLLISALSIAVCWTPPAQARGRGRGLSAAQIRQRTIQMTTAQLKVCREALAAAEVEVNAAASDVSAARGRVEDARKSLQDAHSTGAESARSQRTIEADILAAQSDDSPYAKANLAFHEAQAAVNEERERVLGAASYKEKKAALKNAEEGRAAKLVKLQKDTLADDNEYLDAADKLKAAQVAYVRIKNELFKASPEWVAASKASREADGEETKAHDEATRGAMRALPAKQRLREAQGAADLARAGIAQAEFVLRSLGAPIPKPGGGQSTYSSLSPSSGNK